MTARVFDNRSCELGEGPLWHPVRDELFWFDITGRRMLSRSAVGEQMWAFDEMHSAAGWIDRDHLLIASETGLWRFSIETGARERICDLDSGNPVTRSNDGRADPQGGFWIGTMGKNAEHGAGAIWRWYRGELRRLFAPLTIPNAISFAPDGTFACYCDTVTGHVLRVALDDQGWPAGSAEIFLDLTAQGLNPDGAVIDADGVFWVAQWGAARVAGYTLDGGFVGAYEVPSPHTSCPAFGGGDLATLFVTTALQDMDAAAQAAAPLAGMTFQVATTCRGQAEHRVVLSET